MNEIQFEGRTISRRWKVINLIGSGSFGKVYLAFDGEFDDYCAIKIEENKNDEKLKGESKVLAALNSLTQRKLGIPLMRWYGTDTNFSQLNFMVTDIHGPNLEDLFLLCNRRFSLKTVLMIADSTISLIEYIHQKSFIHRDIKPENFLVGIDNNSHLLYAIDFGLSERYRDPNTHSHVSFKEGRPLVGTARYMSINNHLGIEASRRDDLESLGYMLVYFLNGSLPWQGIDSPNKQEKYERIKEKKMKTQIESYCRSLPPEFAIFLNYARNLIFDEKPDYAFLKKLFEDLFKREGYTRDFCYDWTDPRCINQELIQKKTLSFGYVVDEQVSDQSDDNFSNSAESDSEPSVNRTKTVESVPEPSYLDTQNEKEGLMKELDDSDATDNRPIYAANQLGAIGQGLSRKPTSMVKASDILKPGKGSSQGFMPGGLLGSDKELKGLMGLKKTERTEQDDTDNESEEELEETPKKSPRK